MTRRLRAALRRLWPLALGGAAVFSLAVTGHPAPARAGVTNGVCIPSTLSYTPTWYPQCDATGHMLVTGTMTITVSGTPLPVNVQNTPGVNVQNTPSVNIANTPGVAVQNTPSVNVANTPGVNIVASTPIPVTTPVPLPTDGLGVPYVHPTALPTINANIVATTPIPVTTAPPPAAATATRTSVAATTTTTTCLASNAARRGAVIQNNSTATLFLIFGSAGGVSDYTYSIPAQSNWEDPVWNYTGIIGCVWTASTGNAYVTEVTP